MAASPRDDDFEDYDKPGAERSRRRRGEDDDLDSEFDGDLLDEDWLTAKKNPSEVSDEELNDDLLQSDDEDQNIGQSVSLNATLGEFDQQVNPVDYTDDLGDVERGYQQEGGEYVDEYSQPNDMEMPDGQMEYSGEQAEGDGIYQDEVLDIQINEPLDDEFQVVVPGRGRARGAAGAGGAGQLGCGRGRARGAAVAGGAGQLGCGRLMPTRQNQRGAGTGDSQACTVSIDGLSTSTTDTQLQNLLNSIGPIQMFKMLPHQRKAIAKFHNPQHALSFQVSFNRHMIDLSHIDVSLIDG
uniref:RNA binding motif protein 33 n=1 Tax=Oncorhynchus mykiss TaxID=8022 RepID=A0A8K9V1B7_ONCMY